MSDDKISDNKMRDDIINDDMPKTARHKTVSSKKTTQKNPRNVRSRKSKLIKRSRKSHFSKFFRIIAINFSFIFISLARILSNIWQFATRIDQALWQHCKSIAKIITYGITTFTDWIFDGFKNFIDWLPTKAGRGYCAFVGAVSIIGGLWIADELRTVELTVQAANAKESTPLRTSLRPPSVNSQADPIVARISGEYIYLSQIETAAKSAGTLSSEVTLTLDFEQTTELVQNFIDQRLLAKAARKDNLSKDKLLNARLQIAQDRILAAAYLDKKLTDVVSEEKIFALYKAQSDVTQLGQEIKTYHILVETRADAVDIISALDRGVDFSTIARARSLDRGTAPHGGETGYLTRSMVSEEFGRIAFAFDPGQTSPPFRTSEGWNIVKVIEKRQTQGVPYEDVQDNLRQFLTLRTIDATLKSLRNEFDIVIYDQSTQTDENNSKVNDNAEVRN